MMSSLWWRVVAFCWLTLDGVPRFWWCWLSMAVCRPVDVVDLKQAFRHTDPQVDSADIERYLQWLMADPDKPRQLLASCDADELLSRLHGCNMSRTGHKPWCIVAIFNRASCYVCNVSNMCIFTTSTQCIVQGVPKNWTVSELITLRWFVIERRVVCQKFWIFSRNKLQRLHVGEFKYFFLICINHETPEIMLIWQEHMDFSQFSLNIDH